MLHEPNHILIALITICTCILLTALTLHSETVHPLCFTKLKKPVDKLQSDLTELRLSDDYTGSCDYLDIEELCEVKINKSDLPVIQWNIRGLTGKQTDILKFINQCNQTKIDIIILQEAWLTRTSLLYINVPGYQYEGVTLQNKNGGGVGFLIRNELKYKIQPDLSHHTDNFEHYCIEIKNRYKKCSSI